MKSIMRHFTKRDWFATAGAVVLIALSVWLELLMPDYMKEITELLITPNSSIGDLLWAGGKMLLCALASLIVSVLVMLFFHLLLSFKIVSKKPKPCKVGLMRKSEGGSVIQSLHHAFELFILFTEGRNLLL